MTRSQERIAKEAKALALFGFRNNDAFEYVHASGRITDEEMKRINKACVDHLYLLLSFKARKPAQYWQFIEMVNQTLVREWDEPYADAARQLSRLKDLKKLLGS